MLSNTFKSRYNDDAPIPKYYRSSVYCLEKLTTSGISLPQLEAKFLERQEVSAAGPNVNLNFVSASTQMHRIGGDGGQNAYVTSVLDRVAHIRRIAQQLGEDIARYPPLYFPPGKLLEELNLLISVKEVELLETKKAQMNTHNVSLCLNYLRGQCTRGVTCSFSHTAETLTNWLENWIQRHILEHGESTITIVEEYGAEAWVTLFDLLSKNSTFSSLILRNATRDALRVLFAALHSNAISSLSYLDVGKNNLGDTYPRGVLKLARALTHNTTVSGLAMGYNNIGAAGALALFQSINRSSTSILTTVNLQANGINSEDPAFGYLCQALGQNRLLTKLNLANNELGAEGTKRILESCESINTLRFLDLAGTNMGDHGATYLATFLMETEVGQKLRYLNVSWNKLTHEGSAPICLALTEHTGIEIFRIQYNVGICRKGAIAVCEMIKTAPFLHLVDLRWTSVGDDGAASIIDAVGVSPSVREVLLYGNELASQTEANLHEKLKRKNASSAAASSRHLPSLVGQSTLAFSAADEPRSEPITKSDEVW